MRRRLTKLQRIKVFDCTGGRCHICGLKIHAERGERWEAIHIVSLWAGGADDPSNMAPAHKKPCHRAQTDAEAPERAKSTRLRAAHLGISGPGKGSGPKLPCGRDSRERKTFRRGVVDRRSQSEQHREFMARRYPE